MINVPSKSVMVKPVKSGLFIVLNDSASPKKSHKTLFQFFSIILKVLELFESRRCDLYITANRNFVCFAHS